jgi:hypothetical protein
MDLVALIKDQFSGDIISKIAGAVGMDPGSAQTAMNAGLPAMLAGLTGVASTNDGARRLAMAVDGADAKAPMNFGSMLAGGGRSLLESGGSILNSVLGSGTASTLSGVISRFTGLGSGATGSLMAMMAPLVLGVLKGRKEESHLDAGGLANMLQGQKDNIARAMPAGLGSMLTSALPSFSGMADTARAAVGGAADVTRRTATAAASTGSRWLIPLLLLAGAGLLWWLIARSNVPKTVTPTLPSTPSTTPLRDTGSLALTRVTDQVKDVFKSTTDTLAGITDSATAEAATPKLDAALTSLDTLKRDVAGLPSTVSSSISSVIKSTSPALNAQLDRVKSLAGLSDPVRRLLEEISTRITSLGS